MYYSYEELIHQSNELAHTYWQCNELNLQTETNNPLMNGDKSGYCYC